MSDSVMGMVYGDQTIKAKNEFGYTCHLVRVGVRGTEKRHLYRVFETPIPWDTELRLITPDAAEAEDLRRAIECPAHIV